MYLLSSMQSVNMRIIAIIAADEDQKATSAPCDVLKIRMFTLQSAHKSFRKIKSSKHITSPSLIIINTLTVLIYITE